MIAARRLVPWVVLAIVASAGVPLLLGGERAWAVVLGVDPAWLAVMALALVAAWNLSAARYRLMFADLAPALGQRRAVASVLAMEFAFNATPGGTGAAVIMPAWFARLGVRTADTLAVFAVAALLDAAILLPGFALLLACGYALQWPVALLAPLGTLVGAGIVLLVAAILALRFQRASLRALRRVPVRGRLSRALARQLVRGARRFRRTTRDAMAVPRSRLAAMALLSATQWLLRFSMLWLALVAVGAPFPWGETVATQFIAVAGGQLMMTPGGAGGAEAIALFLLGDSVGPAHAVAAILVWRFMTLQVFLLAGGAVLLRWSLREGLSARS